MNYKYNFDVKCMTENLCEALGECEKLGKILGKQTDKKHTSYGQATDIVPEILKILYPDGIKHEQFKDAVLVILILNKLCRISRGDKTAFEENPYNDIVGYALRGGITFDEKSH